MNYHGHLWTLWPFLKAMARPDRVAAPRPWSVELPDPELGKVRLSGELREVENAPGIVVIVHGLGGKASSHYNKWAVSATQAAGLSSLCICLRGADRLGDDYYHAGLTADLHATLESPEVKRHQDAFVLGYSMGGHVTLLLAAEEKHENLRGVAAVCSPFDLFRAQTHIDLWGQAVYRHYVLGAMKQIYARYAKRHGVPASEARLVARARTIHDWDEFAIAPRHGFRNPEHYYATASVGYSLSKFWLPALHVAARFDPIIPAHSIESCLQGDTGTLEMRWSEIGGHLAFPRNFDLGYGARKGLENQIVHWFERLATS